MRIPRKRMFKIVVDGRESWIEDAGLRTVLETQHKLATELFPGRFVRVIEQYLGGAHSRPVLAPESDEEGVEE